MISAYDREFAKWTKRVEKIVRRYRGDDLQTNNQRESRFNILWSNVQTMIPACFSRMPQPDVSRRYKDTDPVGRVAAMILERALEYELDAHSDFAQAMNECVKDRFLGSRGTAWIRYEPTFGAVQVTEDVTDEDDEQLDPEEEILDEMSPVDYVHWRDFGHNVCRTYEEVSTIWRKVYMGRPALIKRFGEEMGKLIPLDASPEDIKKSANASGADAVAQNQALIYEIWDKPSGKAIWLSKSLGKICDEVDDPLELKDFWPCPRPLYGSLTSETLVPIPDFVQYQDQANELDILSDRIDGLIKALKVRGVYDANTPELARLFTEGDNNTLIPVKNWASFSEKNGLKGAIDIVEILPIAQALREAYGAFEHVKQQIYDLTGMMDIMRGASDPNETATAQNIKQSYGSLRLRHAQIKIAHFATEILRIKAQIMCKFYQPETLARIGAADQLNEQDKQYVGAALQLLKSPAAQSFRIEIAADSMIQMDEQQEKQDRMEFLSAVGNFLKSAQEILAAAPQATPMVMELLKYGVTGFKVGKSVEGVIDQAADEAKQAAQQPKPEQPNPEMLKLQYSAQSDQARMQADMQIAKGKMDADMQLAQAKAQADAQFKQAELAAQQQLEQMRMQHEAAIKQMDLDFQRWKTEFDNSTKLGVAQLSADTSIKTTAMGVSAQSETDDMTEDGTTVAKGGLQQLVQVLDSRLEGFLATNQALAEAVTRPRKRTMQKADGTILTATDEPM